MILLYKNLQEQNLSDYQIKKKLQDKTLYLVAKGVYSTEEKYDPLEVLVKKHPNVILTLETACICYSLIKEEHTKYYVATKQKDRKIKDENVKQIFMTDSLYSVGANVVTYKHYNIRIYDLERLLIEVVRSKTNMEYEKYEQIINSYRKISKLLNKDKINKYVNLFKDKRIEHRIKHEIFDEK